MSTEHLQDVGFFFMWHEFRGGFLWLVHVLFPWLSIVPSGLVSWAGDGSFPESYTEWWMIRLVAVLMLRPSFDIPRQSLVTIKWLSFGVQ